MNYPPPRPPRPRREKRRTFGVSWWGNAWVEAVEQLGELESSRLARGRTYARWNYVGALTVEAGGVRARVAGSRATPYHTWVKVKPFTTAQWDALLDVVSAKIAHAAALIDNELTSDLVEDANVVGVSLLPSAGDLTTGCSCPDDANPCKHSAAVCYLIADLLDDDPFALLLMRGRTQEAVRAGLLTRRQRTSAPSISLGEADEVSAKEAFARTSLGPLPAVPHAPAHPGSTAMLSDALPEHSEVHAGDLEWLARAGAQRAWEMCSGAGSSGLFDTTYRDFVRNLAPLLGTPQFDVICDRARRIRSAVVADVEHLRSRDDDSDAQPD